MFTPRPGTAALPEAVPEKFSWFATLLPPVYAALHRTWYLLVFYLAALAGLAFGAGWIGMDAAIWLYILLALTCGFAAPGACRRALLRRGFAPAGHRFAQHSDLARLAAMEKAS